MTQWKPPTFMEKAKGFTVAYIDWMAAGFPRRSPEWVKEIFETHCKPCDWYASKHKTLLGDTGACLRCQCHVSDDAENMRNKIVLPNTSCPLDPPKWARDVDKPEKEKTK